MEVLKRKEVFSVEGEGVEIGYSDNFPKDALIMFSKYPNHQLLRFITKLEVEGKSYQVRFTFSPQDFSVSNTEGLVFE